jgi:hypothetical protein
MVVEILSKTAARQRQAAGDERVAAITVADVELRERDDFVREISHLWRDVQRRVLLIGRYLNRAKSVLPHGQFQQMIRADLPFSEQVAYQMRKVAAAIDGGRFLEEELPRNYSVAYQLVTLSEAELRVARARQLFHPRVRRSDVLRLKRELRLLPAPADAAETASDREALIGERERLQARLAEIDLLLAASDD